MPDGHPLAMTLATLPTASWAAALGTDGPLPLTLLDLAPLGGPIPSEQLAGLLDATELACYHSFRYPKRQQEWLGGRLAAKAAVAALLDASGSAVPAAAALVIASESSGRPILTAPGLPHAVHLSISHSHERAAALACLHPCGIDLQAATPTVVRVKERFAIPAEEAELAAGLGNQSETRRLTLLWAAKEAIRKMVPVSPLLGFHEATLTEVRAMETAHLLLFSAPKMCHNATRPLRVVAAFFDDYALAAGVLPSTD